VQPFKIHSKSIPDIENNYCKKEHKCKTSNSSRTVSITYTTWPNFVWRHNADINAFMA